MIPARRRKSAVVLVSLAAIGLLFWIGSAQFGQPGSAPPQLLPPGVVPEDGEGPSLESAHQVPAPDAEGVPGRLALLVLDALRGSPVGGVALQVVVPGRAGEEILTDPSGVARIGSPGPVALSVQSHGVVLAGPSSPFPHPEHGTTVWVVRTSELLVRVALEDGGAARAIGTGRVSAGPVRDPGGEGKPLTWLQQRARKYIQAAAELDGELATVSVCRGIDILAVAHVPGYVVGTAVVSAADMERETLEVTIRLRASTPVRIRVRGPDGKPVGGAIVQHISLRETGDGSFNEWTELLVGRATGQGFGASSNPRSGLARFHRIEQAVTGADGQAVVHPMAQEQHRFVRVVAAAMQPSVRSVPSGEDPVDLGVDLQPRPEGPPEYSLRYRGERVQRGTLILAQDIGGWQIAQAPIVSRGGEFDARSIVPGLQYFAILEGTGRPHPLMGLVTFGDQPTVDISHLRDEAGR